MFGWSMSGNIFWRATSVGSRVTHDRNTVLELKLDWTVFFLKATLLKTLLSFWLLWTDLPPRPLPFYIDGRAVSTCLSANLGAMNSGSFFFSKRNAPWTSNTSLF